jgi:hypothetical protein
VRSHGWVTRPSHAIRSSWFRSIHNYAKKLAGVHVHGDLQGARERLSAFIVASAKDTACEAGFGWSARLDAPDQYSVLREHHEQVLGAGSPLHVSSHNSGNVIFTSPEVNHAFRFWHDMHHVKFGLSSKCSLMRSNWRCGTSKQVQKAGFSFSDGARGSVFSRC